MNFTAKISQKENPQLQSSIFGKLTFWWVKDVLWFRKTRDVRASDIYNVLPDHRSDFLSKKLEGAWEREIKIAEKRKTPPSFWKAFINTFKFPFLAILPVPFLYGVIAVLQPLTVKPLISYFHAGANTSVQEALIFATIVIALMIVQSFLHRHAYHLTCQLGMKMRIACSSLVFKKITKLSSASVSSSNEGSIINLLSTDLSKFEYFLLSFYYTLVAPVQFAIATYIMWRNIGAIVVVGLGILIMQCLPLSIFLYNIAKKIRVKLAVRQDDRISLIGEILSGIRTIKMYVWEHSFEKMACLARRLEIKVQMKVSLVNGLIVIISAFAHRSSIFLTILVYTLTRRDPLTAEEVVSIIQLLNTLMMALSVHTMVSSQLAADVKISINRIEEFLRLKEVDHYVKNSKIQNDDICISVKNVSAAWNKDTYALKNVITEINVNKLSCITGIVGSGKSTLLKLILDEFPPTSGEVHVRGSISYASQESWLFPASVRDNILMGEEYNEKKYQEVIEACDLATDFNILHYGDRTLVGEKGMALSGGQCARVNLARAVYKDADIYLFDDPLAAVDVHVSKRIFRNCINGYLKHKTRLLVTNNIDHLQESDKIILMKKGTIEFQGSPEYFNKFIENLSCYSSFRKSKSSNANNEAPTRRQSTVTSAKITEIVKNSNPQEKEELMAEGFISKAVVWEYIRAADSFFLLFFMLVGLVSSYAMFSIFDSVIIAGTKEYEVVFKDINNYTVGAGHYYQSNIENNAYNEKSLILCGGLLLGGLATIILSKCLFYFLFLRANRNIHNKMLACVIRAPMQFFQTNTKGRILNRFSKDIIIADESFLKTTITCACLFFFLLSSFISILRISWWNTIPLIVAVLIFILMTKTFLLTSLGLSRLEGNGSSSITGLLTIRSGRAEDIFCKMYGVHQDYHASIEYLIISTATAHVLYCQLAAIVFLGVVMYSSIPFKEYVHASTIGYVLANMLLLLEFLQYILRLFTEAVNYSISVERLIQYTKLEQEKSIDSSKEMEIPKLWPDVGELKFARVYLHYSRNGEPVLKNLTFTVEPGSKVGIVGRTGAGKSSLIAALFRLAEIDGSILIDGIDTKSINLCDLRSKISIIPQEPFLFSASLRENVDPLGEFDDASIWSALRDVELNQTFSSLEHPIKKAGGNLSLGERQLLCLARAIVKKNKILVLDEATANVDSATDALIQKIIRTKFKGCTVLIIAHRLNTIMDSDKILVVDKGEMVEFDRPDLLLLNKDGHFAKMVQASDVTAVTECNEVTAL